MFWKHQLEQLTEDELSVIIYGINTYFPCAATGDINENILLAYKSHTLPIILEHKVKPNLNENGLKVLQSAVDKLFNGKKADNKQLEFNF